MQLTYLSELAEVRLDVFDCRVGAQSSDEDLFRTRDHLKYTIIKKINHKLNN